MTSINGKRRFEHEIKTEDCKRLKTMDENSMEVSVKQEKLDANNFQNTHMRKKYSCTQHLVIENSLSQIAIKNGSSNGAHKEVIVLKANWETTKTIPNIVAEMHNVKLEEIQNSWAAENTDRYFLEVHDTHYKKDDFVSPSPQGSDSGLGSDSPEGNLSWLLNFKLDEIPGLPVSDYPTTPTNNAYSNGNRRNDSHAKLAPVYLTENGRYYDNPQNDQSQIISGEESASKSHRYSSPRKPPFTYTELIEHALREKGELTVSGIYQWISDHFSFYKANDDRWKNSVRHNLSINPHFRKGSKAIHGAGHLWTIAQKDDDLKSTSSWNVKKQRMQQFMRSATSAELQRQREQDMELAAATASIIPENEQFEHIQNDKIKPRNSMHQTAEDILGGIKREVEVQYVIPVGNSMDFMCPVSKEQVAEECGLGNEEMQSNDYLITDLNPNTLGLNLSEAEIITSEQLFSDDLNFQCYELTTEQ